MNVYSLDFWGTICKANQLFKHIRAQEISQSEFNLLKRSPEEIYQKINQIGKSSDKMIERSYGKDCLSISQMYYLLEEFLSNNESKLTSEYLRVKVDGMFLKYPPELIDKDLSLQIKALQQSGNIIGISSNTGWISGELISSVLHNYNIIPDFTIYSDEININKPNDKFFKNIIEDVTYKYRGTFQLETKLKSDNLHHIGDNEVTDYFGSQRNGFTPHLVTKENTLIKVLKSIPK